jgi:signal peptidase I
LQILENIRLQLDHLPTWVIVLLCVVGFIGLVAQWALYRKCGFKGFSAIIPVWNVIVLMRIVGRPNKQGWMVMIPPMLVLLALVSIQQFTIGAIISSVILAPWSWFMVKIYMDVARSFGKNKWYHFLFIVLFNGLYVYHLALSPKEKYTQPSLSEIPS